MDYVLGTLEASEQLIKDLYVDLRDRVNQWSEITKQTPQARMGYIGQHLVSVVTGFPGGKSGARGYDIVMEDDKYGEIKTCYRVDQLGKCANCNNVVSSLETECSACGSTDIIRKDDSKWLIGIRHDQEFAQILDPFRYYFVLFEFEEINNQDNNNIIASIWEVNPLVKGFAYCMMDYYVNIRAKSESKAPFNMWPHQLKFALTEPMLIYRSVIKGDGSIETIVFPTNNNTYIDVLDPTLYSQAKIITADNIKKVLKHFHPEARVIGKTKLQLLTMIKDYCNENDINNHTLCETFADAIYLPLLTPKKDELPEKLTRHYSDLQ